MSLLMVEELKTSLIQGFEVTYNKRYQLESIIPHLYVHNLPSGTFTFTFRKGATSLFTHSFDASDIKDSMNATLDYVHIYYPVIPSNSVFLEKGNYSLELTQSGYTFSELNYLGWIRNFDRLENIDDQQLFTEGNPMEIRFKTRAL